MHKKVDSFLRQSLEDYEKVFGSALSYRFFSTPIGDLFAWAAPGYLISLQFYQTLAATFPKGGGLGEVLLSHLASELSAYFSGTLKAFTIAVQPQRTEFQRRVIDGLAQIPIGKTGSYQKFSEPLGVGRAYRSVARALAQNSCLIVSPCPRLIRTDGSLGGYAGGMARKRWLLDHERSSIIKACGSFESEVLTPL